PRCSSRPARRGPARRAKAAEATSAPPVHRTHGAALIRPRVEAVHGRFRALFEDGFDGVGGHLDGHVEGLLVGLARTPEDMVGALALARRLVDADAHAYEAVVVEVGLDRLQAVVAGGAATDLELHAADGEVELVVDDDQVSEVLDAVPADKGGDRQA